MRRILLLLCMAALAVGAPRPAEAKVLASCAQPFPVGGSAKVGVTVSPDGRAVLCIRQDATTSYEIVADAKAFTYGGPDAIWGTVAAFCRHHSSGSNCATASVGGAFVVSTKPDMVKLVVTPSVCTTSSTAFWDDCSGAYVVTFADGPVGSTFGIDGEVYLCDGPGTDMDCPGAPVTKDLSGERTTVYSLLVPIP